MSLITVDAHARDIVLMLIRDNVTDKVGDVLLLLYVVVFMIDGENMTTIFPAFPVQTRALPPPSCLDRMTFNGLLSSSSAIRESRATQGTPNSLWRRSTY